MTAVGRSLGAVVRDELRIADDEWPAFPAPDRPVPLPARTDVAGLAWDAVCAATAAAAAVAGADAIAPHPDRIALAYTSDRHVRLDGAAPTSFAPLSGFFRTSDGWVRTHGNYPWHARALRSVLGLQDRDAADAAARAFAQVRAATVSEAIVAAGGLCVPVRREVPTQDEQWERRPLIQTGCLGEAVARRLPGPTRAAPLAGIRVLDLTRVIAGPVATRTLALLGADVLRIDPPARPEIPWQHLDTGHGKRSALLDLRDSAARTRFDDLLAAADVVVLGYRSDGLAALGLDPATIAARNPGIVIAQLTAWGDGGGRGFDSLVQAASGISWIESADDATPGVLPAQALDHTAGYLLACAVISLLARRARVGGTWLAATSLRRVAAHLLGRERSAEPAPVQPVDDDAHLQSFRVGGAELTTVGPAVTYSGGPDALLPPRSWGADEPAWVR